METQTCVSCHYKFILPENIIILSVSSDDFLHVRLEVAEQQMWNYRSYVYEKKSSSQAKGKGIKTIRVRNIEKQGQEVPVGQPIPI